MRQKVLTCYSAIANARRGAAGASSSSVAAHACEIPRGAVYDTARLRRSSVIIIGLQLFGGIDRRDTSTAFDDAGGQWGEGKGKKERKTLAGS